MLGRFTLKSLFSLRRPPFTKMLFSSSSQKLNTLFQSISVQSQSGKTTNLLQSGMIVSQSIDPQTKKVTISLNLNKDYRRIKALLKQRVEEIGFTNVDIGLVKGESSGLEQKQQIKEGFAAQSISFLQGVPHEAKLDEKILSSQTILVFDSSSSKAEAGRVILGAAHYTKVGREGVSEYQIMSENCQREQKQLPLTDGLSYQLVKLCDINYEIGERFAFQSSHSLTHFINPFGIQITKNTTQDHIVRFKDATTLSSRNTKLYEFSEHIILPQLTTLDLFENKLSSIDLSNNKNLKFLNLSNNRLKSISLNNLANLTVLWLSYNNISKINLASNERLAWIDLSDCGLEQLILPDRGSIVVLNVRGNSSDKRNLKKFRFFYDPEIFIDHDFSENMRGCQITIACDKRNSNKAKAFIEKLENQRDYCLYEFKLEEI